VDKFITFIEEGIKKKSLKEIKSYKRIPWLDVWLEKTKEVALDLTCYGGGVMNEGTTKKICPDVKMEPLLNCSFDEEIQSEATRADQ